jgi:hypothetical protein
VETPHYILNSNAQKIATEEEMNNLLINPPDGISSGVAKVYQYIGPDGTYTKGSFYVLEVKT